MAQSGQHHLLEGQTSEEIPCEREEGQRGVVQTVEVELVQVVVLQIDFRDLFQSIEAIATDGHEEAAGQSKVLDARKTDECSGGAHEGHLIADDQLLDEFFATNLFEILPPVALEVLRLMFIGAANGRGLFGRGEDVEEQHGEEERGGENGFGNHF